MKKIIPILFFPLVLVFTGCANLDYTKNLKQDELIYSTSNQGAISKININLPIEYQKIGAEKTGYVGEDLTEDRKQLDINFPIVPHDKASLDAISDSHNHRMRIGQALVFSADTNQRTSGFLKDKDNKPLSISGRFTPNPDAAILQGLTSGVAIGAASGVMTVNSINSQLSSSGLKLSQTGTNAVAGGQMAQGLVAGLLAGGIHAAMAETAIKEIVSAKTFGEMVQGTTLVAAHLLPNLAALGPDGLVGTSAPIVLAPGIVKRYFLKFNQKTLDYKNQYTLITAIGTYRGRSYEEKYPYTSGWDYYISNMALFYLNADESNDPEKSFIGIRREVRLNNLI